MLGENAVVHKTEMFRKIEDGEEIKIKSKPTLIETMTSVFKMNPQKILKSKSEAEEEMGSPFLEDLVSNLSTVLMTPEEKVLV